MEISRLSTLRANFSSFIHLSSDNGIRSDLIQKYYQKPVEILKLLKPILDAIVDCELVSDERFDKTFQELGQSVDQLRELIETWQPLLSKANFVLQFESSITKLRSSGLDFFQLLKSSSLDLPEELSSSSLEYCIEKIKHMECAHTTSVIKKAIEDQVDGVGCNPEILVEVADLLCLRSSQEILIEAVALEKLKENAEQAEKTQEAESFDAMISLVTRMHDRLVLIKQSETSSPVPIPLDFCCPLSLELMTDPVILSSGQTYERAFIKNWIEMGLTVCPKTRLTLGHTNLIPNFTVKALIASWCESKDVKLPDPKKPLGPNQHSSVDLHAETGSTKNSNAFPYSRSNQEMSPESTSSAGSPKFSSNKAHREGRPLHPHSAAQGPLTTLSGNVQNLDIQRISVLGSGEKSLNSEGRGMESASRHSVPLPRMDVPTPVNADGHLSLHHIRSASASSALNGANFSQGSLVDASEAPELSNHTSSCSCEISEELKAETQSSAVNNTHKEPELTPQLIDNRSRSQTIWRRPSNRPIPRMVSSPATETRMDISGIETRVQKLVEDLKSPSIDTQRKATADLRQLAKHNTDHRIVIATCGAIGLLVYLLSSTDSKTQENAVTALLNLSIDDNNKAAIANAEAIEPLIQVLKKGSPEAKENSAATLFSLSVVDENKAKIGRSGAIVPLVDLLGNGTSRGKKDAATALFNLSLLHENKFPIVEAGAVKYLIELMDPAFGMVDKAVAVLANLATIQEGKMQIGQVNGITALVEVVELGSARGKENAAAALWQLCTHDSRFTNEVLREGAVPPLVALSQSGTPRAKEKAQSLLRHFKTQRNGNAERG